MTGRADDDDRDDMDDMSMQDSMGTGQLSAALGDVQVAL